MECKRWLYELLKNGKQYSCEVVRVKTIHVAEPYEDWYWYLEV